MFGAFSNTADVIYGRSLMSNDVEGTGHAKLIYSRAPQQWEGRRLDPRCEAFGACVHTMASAKGGYRNPDRDSPVAL